MEPELEDKEHSETSGIFTRDFERRDGRVLTIAQREVGDVGCVVWDAAIVLSYYLETSDFCDDSGCSQLVGKSVVELGAGTGLVGIQAAACGANCVITDLPELVQLIQLNIDANKHQLRGKAAAKELNWESSDDWDLATPPNFIVMADCIYYDASVKPLYNTVSRLCGRDTVILCCYEERLSGNKPELLRQFLELFETDFNVEQVPMCRHDSEYCSSDIHILRMTKKC